MDNPFENVVIEVQKRPKVKKTLKLSQLLELFPEESENSIILKAKMAEKIRKENPDFSIFKLFKVTQLIFNKYFYDVSFQNEQEIDNILTSIKDFDVFKTN